MISISNDSSNLLMRNLLLSSSSQMNRSLKMLASGYRINGAGDDAAGLQISESLRSQMRGQSQSDQNIQDASNMLNIAEGSMEGMNENLQRVRELAVQGASDLLAPEQRQAIQQEMNQRIQEVDRLAGSTQFNGQALFGNISQLNVQVGANSSTDNTIDLAGNSAVGALNASGLGLKSGTTVTLGVGSNASALQSISKLDNAIQNLSNRRASIGAMSNRLESASQASQISLENTAATESRIRNSNFAAATSEFVKSSILQQASVALMGQNKTSAFNTLDLLGSR
ncbi:MAG: flagellin FliC [Vampirovibrio sp.]